MMDSFNQIAGLEILASTAIKKVTKPWGHEIWYAEGAPKFRYAFKEIFIRAPHRTSLQFHEFKQEVNYIKEGEAILHYHPTLMDARRFRDGGYSKEELDRIISEIRTVIIPQGSIFRVWPGMIHRVEARDCDLTMIEASTPEVDDVYRLQDDTNREHGRIENEHHQGR